MRAVLTQLTGEFSGRRCRFHLKSAKDVERPQMNSILPGDYSYFRLFLLQRFFFRFQIVNNVCNDGDNSCTLPEDFESLPWLNMKGS